MVEYVQRQLIVFNAHDGGRQWWFRWLYWNHTPPTIIEIYTKRWPEIDRDYIIRMVRTYGKATKSKTE